MKTTILIMLVCFSHSAIAETYKCIQSGKTIYSSFPCADNAQVVANHIMTIDALPRENIQEQDSVQAAPIQPAAPRERSAVLPARAVAAPTITCTSEEAAFEAVKKAIQAGYPASLSDYWHYRFVKTRDDYDLCREKLQKSMAKK